MDFDMDLSDSSIVRCSTLFSGRPPMIPGDVWMFMNFLPVEAFACYIADGAFNGRLQINVALPVYEYGIWQMCGIGQGFHVSHGRLMVVLYLIDVDGYWNTSSFKAVGTEGFVEWYAKKFGNKAAEPCKAAWNEYADWRKQHGADPLGAA